jgi:signal transduction histidine kinase
MLVLGARSSTTASWGSWIIGSIVAFGGGRFARKLVRVTTDLREAQASLSAQAADDERRRIAREVHDVIAHSLTVTMLHLTGARLTLQHDPAAVDEVIAALEQAERLGRQSLDDIRRTVGLLTGDGVDAGGDGRATMPEPSLPDVVALVDTFRNANVAVDVTIKGDQESISLPTGLGLYRIVQEALTNAAKHAPGAPVSVDIDCGDGYVTLRVHNGPSRFRVLPTETAGSGMGLPGMHNRAALLGGQVSAGPDGPHNGWTVQARLPSGSVERAIRAIDAHQ